MAIFDGHLKCAICQDKGAGEDNCVLKNDCPICKAFTPEQVQQLTTPTCRKRKKQRQENGFSLPYPHSCGPFTRKFLGKVEGEKAIVQPETTPAGKKKK